MANADVNQAFEPYIQLISFFLLDATTLLKLLIDFCRIKIGKRDFDEIRLSHNSREARASAIERQLPLENHKEKSPSINTFGAY